MLYSSDGSEIFEAPYIRHVQISVVMKHEPLVGLSIELRGSQRDTVRNDLPFKYMAVLEIDIAKALYRELGQVIDQAVASQP